MEWVPGVGAWSRAGSVLGLRLAVRWLSGSTLVRLSAAARIAARQGVELELVAGLDPGFGVSTFRAFVGAVLETIGSRQYAGVIIRAWQLGQRGR